MSSQTVNSTTITTEVSTYPPGLIISNILPLGVLAWVVTALVLLVLVTALVTCFCWLARGMWEGSNDEEGKLDSEYWSPEKSEHSLTTSSFSGEILREEEVDSMKDISLMQQRKPVAASPSIFSPGDFLMKDLGGSQFRPGACSSVMKNRGNSIDLEVMNPSLGEVEDEFDDAQLCFLKKSRSASTVALYSFDLDSPALAQGYSQVVTQAEDQGKEDGKVVKIGNGGGWLLYSIMREITTSPRNCESMTDEVFQSSQDPSMRNSKPDNEVSEPSKDCLGENVDVLKYCADDLTAAEQTHPLEVRVIIGTDSGC